VPRWRQVVRSSSGCTIHRRLADTSMSTAMRRPRGYVTLCAAQAVVGVSDAHRHRSNATTVRHQIQLRRTVRIVDAPNGGAVRRVRARRIRAGARAYAHPSQTPQRVRTRHVDRQFGVLRVSFAWAVLRALTRRRTRRTTNGTAIGWDTLSEWCVLHLKRWIRKSHVHRKVRHLLAAVHERVQVHARI
jgi:hypothetical protein